MPQKGNLQMETTNTFGQPITKLLTYFRLPGETLGAFAAELKKLTTEEKVELAEGVAALEEAQAA